MRDNGLVIIPRGFVQQGQLATAIANVERMLGPEVIHVRHTLGDDWSGEPAIFFRVLLSDAASRPDRLHEVTSRIAAIISQQVDPLNSWGLVPYFKFRSQSEQAIIQEPVWA